ncbi:MAG: hypothetical protein JXB88_01635 [Spirochaetales bacterium]|nr:hypothetical protein [Spirochaetales bacterium]
MAHFSLMEWVGKITAAIKEDSSGYDLRILKSTGFKKNKNNYQLDEGSIGDKDFMKKIIKAEPLVVGLDIRELENQKILLLKEIITHLVPKKTDVPSFAIKPAKEESYTPYIYFPDKATCEEIITALMELGLDSFNELRGITTTKGIFITGITSPLFLTHCMASGATLYQGTGYREYLGLTPLQSETLNQYILPLLSLFSNNETMFVFLPGEDHVFSCPNQFNDHLFKFRMKYSPELRFEKAEIKEDEKLYVPVRLKKSNYAGNYTGVIYKLDLRNFKQAASGIYADMLKLNKTLNRDVVHYTYVGRVPDSQYKTQGNFFLRISGTPVERYLYHLRSELEAILKSLSVGENLFAQYKGFSLPFKQAREIILPVLKELLSGGKETGDSVDVIVNKMKTEFIKIFKEVISEGKEDLQPVAVKIDNLIMNIAALPVQYSDTHPLVDKIIHLIENHTERDTFYCLTTPSSQIQLYIPFGYELIPSFYLDEKSIREMVLDVCGNCSEKEEVLSYLDGIPAEIPQKVYEEEIISQLDREQQNIIEKCYSVSENSYKVNNPIEKEIKLAVRNIFNEIAFDVRRLLLCLYLEIETGQQVLHIQAFKEENFRSLADLQAKVDVARIEQTTPDKIEELREFIKTQFKEQLLHELSEPAGGYAAEWFETYENEYTSVLWHDMEQIIDALNEQSLEREQQIRIMNIKLQQAEDLVKRFDAGSLDIEKQVENFLSGLKRIETLNQAAKNTEIDPQAYNRISSLPVQIKNELKRAMKTHMNKKITDMLHAVDKKMAVFTQQLDEKLSLLKKNIHYFNESAIKTKVNNLRKQGKDVQVNPVYNFSDIINEFGHIDKKKLEYIIADIRKASMCSKVLTECEKINERIRITYDGFEKSISASLEEISNILKILG